MSGLSGVFVDLQPHVPQAPHCTLPPPRALAPDPPALQRYDASASALRGGPRQLFAPAPQANYGGSQPLEELLLARWAPRNLSGARVAVVATLERVLRTHCNVSQGRPWPTPRAFNALMLGEARPYWAAVRARHGRRDTVVVHSSATYGRPSRAALVAALLDEPPDFQRRVVLASIEADLPDDFSRRAQLAATTAPRLLSLPYPTVALDTLPDELFGAQKERNDRATAAAAANALTIDSAAATEAEQQLNEAREKARAFRAVAQAELSASKASLDAALLEQSSVKSRIGQLEAWLRATRAALPSVFNVFRWAVRARLRTQIDGLTAKVAAERAALAKVAATVASRQSDRDDAAVAAERANAAAERALADASSHATRLRAGGRARAGAVRTHAERRAEGALSRHATTPWKRRPILAAVDTRVCAQRSKRDAGLRRTLADQIVAAGGRCLGPDGATENGGCDATALLLCWVCAAPPPTGGYPASSVCGLPGPIDAMPPLALLEQTRFSLEPAGDTPTRAHFYYALAAGAVPVLFDGGHATYSATPRAGYPWRTSPTGLNYSSFTVAFDGRAAVAGSSGWLASLRAAAAAPSAGRDFRRGRRAALRALLFSNARGGDDAFAPLVRAVQERADTVCPAHPDVGPAPERSAFETAPDTVPFYLYPPERFTLYSECKRHELRGELVKHGIAPLFIERLHNHPWRTDDPQRAVVFIVPALLDWYGARLCGKRSLASHLDNLGREINGTYAAGRRHVVLAANWQTHNPRFGSNRLGRKTGHREKASVLQRVRTRFPGFVFGTYLQTAERCTFGVGYLANHDAFAPTAPWNARSTAAAAPLADSAPADDDAPRPYEVEFIGSVESRRPGHADRVGFFTSKHKLGPSNFVVTPSSSLAGVRRCAGADDRNYCVTVDIDRRASQKLHAQATYSLVLRGDDQSSDRLVNALAALQVPLLVGDDMASWLPFRSAVPWGRLLFRIDRAAFLADPPAAVRNLTAAISPALLAQTRRLARAHLPDLLWAVPGSRVHENILRAAAATACENCWRQRPSLATPRDITVPTAVEAARRSKRAERLASVGVGVGGGGSAGLAELRAALQDSYSRHLYGRSSGVPVGFQIVYLPLVPPPAAALLRRMGVCVFQSAPDASPLYAPHSIAFNPSGSVWVHRDPGRAEAEVLGAVGTPPHSWVEVTHCGSLDEWRRAGTRRWLYLARGSGVAVNVGRTVVIDEAYLVRSGAFGYEDEVTQAKLDLLCLRESASAAAAVACHPDGAATHADDDADPLPPEVVEAVRAADAKELPCGPCCRRARHAEGSRERLLRPSRLLRAIGASFADFCAADSLQRLRHREFYSSELRDELILLGGVDGGGLVSIAERARCAAALDGRCDPAAPPLRYMLGEFEGSRRRTVGSHHDVVAEVLRTTLGARPSEPTAAQLAALGVEVRNCSYVAPPAPVYNRDSPAVLLRPGKTASTSVGSYLRATNCSHHVTQQMSHRVTAAQLPPRARSIVMLREPCERAASIVRHFRCSEAAAVGRAYNLSGLSSFVRMMADPTTRRLVGAPDAPMHLPVAIAQAQYVRGDTRILCHGPKLEGALQALCRTTARLPHLRDGVAACAVADQEVAVGSQACEAVRRDVYPEDWALWKRHCQG